MFSLLDTLNPKFGLGTGLFTSSFLASPSLLPPHHACEKLTQVRLVMGRIHVRHAIVVPYSFLI